MSHLLSLVTHLLPESPLGLLSGPELFLDGLRDSGLHGGCLTFLSLKHFFTLFSLGFDLESDLAQLFFHYFVLFVTDVLLVFESLA